MYWEFRIVRKACDNRIVASIAVSYLLRSNICMVHSLFSTLKRIKEKKRKCRNKQMSSSDQFEWGQKVKRPIWDRSRLIWNEPSAKGTTKKSPSQERMCVSASNSTSETFPISLSFRCVNMISLTDRILLAVSATWRIEFHPSFDGVIASVVMPSLSTLWS